MSLFPLANSLELGFVRSEVREGDNAVWPKAVPGPTFDTTIRSAGAPGEVAGGLAYRRGAPHRLHALGQGLPAGAPPGGRAGHLESPPRSGPARPEGPPGGAPGQVLGPPMDARPESL